MQDESRRLAFRVSWKRTLLDASVLALSGWALTLSEPGVDWSALAWCAAIPLLFLCERVGARRAFFYGLVWGWFWNATTTMFLREINWCIPFVFGIVLGLFCAVWSASIPIFMRNLLYPIPVRLEGHASVGSYFRFSPWNEILCTIALSSFWVLLEWARSHVLTGFPWGLLAATQWKTANLIQICEYTGIYGVSFLVIFVNVAGYFALRGLAHSLPEGRYKRPWPLLLAAVLVFAASGFGARLALRRAKEMREQPTVQIPIGVVQPNLSQRRHGDSTSAQEALDVCVRLTRTLMKEDAALRSVLQAGFAESANETSGTQAENEPLKLIVWPETAVPRAYYQMTPFSAQYRRRVRSLMKESSIPFLIGTIDFEPSGDGGVSLYNSALLLKPVDDPTVMNTSDRADSYSKVHLVPFGEFIPLNKRFPALGRMVGMGYDLTPGKGFHPLNVSETIRPGVLICYEDVFPYTAREQARNGANFLLVLTNDAWYPTSSESKQHYANSVFRCIETRLPMARAGNMNYSVLIDPFGNAVDSVSKRLDPKTGRMVVDPGAAESAAARFVVSAARDPRVTFYVAHGDVFVLILGFAFLFGAATASFRAFAYRRALLESEETPRD